MKALILLLAVLPAAVAQPSSPSVSRVAAAKTASPAIPDKEMLRYTVSWATGLSLGEVQLSSTRIAGSEGDSYEFTFQAEAAVPKFPIAEWTRGLATPDLCSIEAEKKALRGQRKSDEKTTFDRDKLTASRETIKGGKSQLSTGPCARDAVTYLAFLRRELAHGRLPKLETVYYGAPYQVTVQFAGTEKIKSGEQSIDAERVNLLIKGPASKVSAEAFFARDPARTPLMIRFPVTGGAIVVELQR